MVFEPQEILKQIVITVDQHAVVRPGARAMTQNTRRRFVVRADRRQIPIDQRLNNSLALAAVRFRAGLVGGQL